MNTIELLNKAQTDATLSQIFIGVFASDNIPCITKVPAALIINLDKSDSPGSHWIALFFTKCNKCEYFDSYGRKPNSCILKYIAKQTKTYIYNNVCVQDLWTISCGQMCLYFLVWRCRGISFSDIVKSMVCDDFIAGFIDSL